MRFLLLFFVIHSTNLFAQKDTLMELKVARMFHDTTYLETENCYVVDSSLKQNNDCIYYQIICFNESKTKLKKGKKYRIKAEHFMPTRVVDGKPVYLLGHYMIQKHANIESCLIFEGPGAPVDTVENCIEKWGDFYQIKEIL